MSIEADRPECGTRPSKEVIEFLEDAATTDHCDDKGQVQERGLRTPEQTKTERSLVLKADFIILPLIFVTHLLASLDRSDLGNAAVAGMTKDLHMTPQQLSTAASMFYVTYVLFQLPGSICLKLVDPNIQIALAMMIWGLFNTLLCIARSYATVIGFRLGVGLGEAFFQAAPVFLTLWYKRSEYAKRSAIMFSSSAVAGAFNGLIAYGVERSLAGKDNLASWRWLFIVEGCLAIGWGVLTLLLLPSLPEKSRFYFTTAEKELAVQRTTEAFNDPHSKIHWKSVFKSLLQIDFWLFSTLFSCGNISLASFSTFLPVILRALGYSRYESQFLTIPVYAVAAVSTIVVCFFSDRFRTRGYFLIGCFTSNAAGWLILLVSKSHKLSFAGTFLIGAGTYPCIVLGYTWVLNNQASFSRRAGTYAMVSMIAQCFSIAGTEIYSDPPTYYRGNGFALGASIVGVCACITLVIRLKSANRRKAAAAETEEAVRQRLQSLEELSNDHPDFYYFI